jgi:hypothetical protein
VNAREGVGRAECDVDRIKRIKMAHTLDVEKLAEVFEQLESEDRLSKWEMGFVESVKAQWEEGRKLSEAQLEKLEQIWCKY